MVTGADEDRLSALLGIVYAFVALLTVVPALLGRGRPDERQADPPDSAEPAPTAGGVGTT